MVGIRLQVHHYDLNASQKAYQTYSNILLLESLHDCTNYENQHLIPHFLKTNFRILQAINRNKTLFCINWFNVTWHLYGKCFCATKTRILYYQGSIHFLCTKYQVIKKISPYLGTKCNFLSCS